MFTTSTRRLVLTAVLTFAALVAVPSTAHAADDNITALNPNPSQVDANSTGSIAFEFTTTELSSGTILYFGFSDEEGVTTAADISGLSYDNDLGVTAAYAQASFGGKPIGSLTLEETLSAGAHSFTISGVAFGADKSLSVFMSSTEIIDGSGLAIGNMTIGEGSDEEGGEGDGGGDSEELTGTETNLVSDGFLELDPAIVSQTSTLTFEFELNDTLQINEPIYIFFQDGPGGPSTTDFDFSGVSLDASSTFEGSARLAEGRLTISPSEALSSETEYTAVVTGVENASKVTTYETFVTTMLVNESTSFLQRSNALEALTKPSRIGKKNLRVPKKHLKKKKARVVWGEPKTGLVSKYQVQVRKCKNATKKLCTKAKHFQKKKKFKKYRNVKVQEQRSNKRKLARKLKPGTYYQFRVRACNDAGCPTYSPWKRFKTKGVAQ